MSGQTENIIEFRVSQKLIEYGLKIFVAESCTGGLISHLLTNMAGSSDYFLGGVITYSNEVKELLLKVHHETLREFGAVSSETALEMARGARRQMENIYGLENLIGLSATGIAGPGGAVRGKPVGFFWAGLSTPWGDFSQHYQFSGNRLNNKEFFAKSALGLFLEKLDDYVNDID